jgi:DtxR family Mn-dependent transcriptional regulator
MQSLSEKNYLKGIYHLSKMNIGKVTITAISENMHVNPASVTDMLKKLTEKQLITYDKKNGAVLTLEGEKSTVAVVRRHRLCEVFLRKKLGCNWQEVHEIAKQLGHVHHHDLANRLDKFLGFPTYDPREDPIPQANRLPP